MGPNEQNQHFAEFGQKVCLYIHILVLQRGLPSLDGKLECFVTKRWKKGLPNSSQTDYIVDDERVYLSAYFFRIDCRINFFHQ